MTFNESELKNIFLCGETLRIEFKSDRKPLADRELVATVVAIANTEGGELFLGVEDGGTVTGVHPDHQNPGGLASLIANRTNPPMTVRAELVGVDDKLIIVVQVWYVGQYLGRSHAAQVGCRHRFSGDDLAP